MKLAEYLSLSGLSDAQFANLIGRDRTSVSRLRRGETRPDWDTMQEIARHTKGAVTPNDFLPPGGDDTAAAAPAEAAQ